MKHCPYCHTDYARSETRCTSCQAPDYENRCTACSTIFSGGECPKCGLGASDELRPCSNCGKRTKGEYCEKCADKAAKVAAGEQQYIKNQEILANSKQKVSGGICLPGLHAWRGCTCTRCGKKKDDWEGCDWLGCTCKICGTVIDTNHSYYPMSINGDTERCVICGKTRSVKVELAKAEKNKALRTILLLIAFPPIGILMTWFVRKEWQREYKKNVTIASSIWLFVLIVLAVLFPPILSINFMALFLIAMWMLGDSVN